MKIKITTLLALACFCGIMFLAAPAFATNSSQNLQNQLASLEKSANGRLGLVMLNADGSVFAAYRATELFPFCSTFKLMLTGAVLKKSVQEPELLKARPTYSKNDLATWSPITEKRLDSSASNPLTTEELCAAAMLHSDNTAANLLLKLLGGPAALNAFARSLGDSNFRLDRYEPDLNKALPGDVRDTTTPMAMALSLRQLAVANALPIAQKKLLVTWLQSSTTGKERIKAGLPATWSSGDKTGSGPYGTTNDIALIWPPSSNTSAKDPNANKPLVLAIYFTQPQKDAPVRQDVLAAATRLLIEHWLASDLSK